MEKKNPSPAGPKGAGAPKKPDPIHAPAAPPVPAAPAAVPAKPLDLDGALAAVTERFPAEAAHIQAILKRDVLALGTDKVFALRDEKGEIRAFKQPLRLARVDGTLIQPVANGPFVVSAQGYEVWQEASGACTIFPQQVLVDGSMMSNPYVVRDPANRRILSIYARAVAFRFSSKGIPQVSDWTTIFDVPSYRLIDLLAKAKQTPQAFKLLPADVLPPAQEGATWASYPFDESTKLWVNTGHPEVLQWYAQIINREKKAIDFAQTFAKRNALKHLSGLQRAPGDTWTIPVICWRPTSGSIVKWDATTYANLERRVSGLISGKAEADVPKIELQRGVERVSEEEGAEGIMQTIDPEDQADFERGGEANGAAAPPAPAPDVPQVIEVVALSDEDRRIMANLAETRAQFPEEFAAAMMALGLEADADLLPQQALEVMNKVSLLVDSAGA